MHEIRWCKSALYSCALWKLKSLAACHFDGHRVLHLQLQEFSKGLILDIFCEGIDDDQWLHFYFIFWDKISQIFCFFSVDLTIFDYFVKKLGKSYTYWKTINHDAPPPNTKVICGETTDDALTNFQNLSD